MLKQQNAENIPTYNYAGITGNYAGITTSKNLQTRIASAGLKTPRSISRRLLPGKVAFFLKGKNKRAFGVSNNYIYMHTYIPTGKLT